MVVAFKLVLRTAKVSKDVHMISDSGMDPLQTMQNGFLPKDLSSVKLLH